MFEGFKHTQIQTSDPEVRINLRYGGSGPPILLIHGNPLTHVHWHLVAPRLARDFTVVVTDLRGYGDSSKPRGKEDHSNYSFRRMGQDQIDVMQWIPNDVATVAMGMAASMGQFLLSAGEPGTTSVTLPSLVKSRPMEEVRFSDLPSSSAVVPRRKATLTGTGRNNSHSSPARFTTSTKCAGSSLSYAS